MNIMDIQKLKMSNGRTVEQNLLDQANLLRELIQNISGSIVDLFRPKTMSGQAVSKIRLSRTAWSKLSEIGCK